MYQSKIQDITDLKTTDAISTTDETVLQWTGQEIKYCVNVLCATNSVPIEVESFPPICLLICLMDSLYYAQSDCFLNVLLCFHLSVKARN